MRLLILVVCIFFNIVGCQSKQSLFNGHDFSGWEGPLDYFHIEKDAIVGGHLDREIPENFFVCTEKRFQNFDLKLQAKLVGEGANAGIQFRTKRIPNDNEVIGYQADMGTVDEDMPPVMAGDLIWGSIYDESRRNKFIAWADQQLIKKVFKPGDWNDYRIRCQGNHIEIWLNGAKTIDYFEEDPDIEDSGIICLQIHSGPPCQAWYRNIAIEPLD